MFLYQQIESKFNENENQNQFQSYFEILDEMFSKIIFAQLLALTFLSCESLPLDVGKDCIAKYLKDRNKLEDSFSVPENIEPTCQLLMPIIMKTFEIVLCKKLADKESIKAECVIDGLRHEGALEYMLKQELILMSSELKEDESKLRLEEVKEKLRIIFEETARICKSDPTYAGLFNDILEIKNESLAVLRQDYCFTKFVIESKLIDVQDVDFNPKQIVTSNIDCQTMIKNNRIEREKKLLEAFKNRNITKEQLQCIKDKFQIDRAFDSNLALEVIDQIDVSLEVRKKNRAKIAKQLENFVKSVFMCVGKMADKNQSTVLRL